MLKRLDRAEMEEIYRRQMPGDFPPAELKPWKRIEEMLAEGVYFAYGLYEEGRLMAYAFFVETDRRQILLDYYAVSAQARGRGIGSRFIALLREELQRQGCSVLLIEVENPDYARTEEERKQQQRRIHFYEKNGVQMTGQQSCLFSVEYKIMYLPMQGEKEEGELRAALERIYHTMFPQKYFGKEVRIR